MADKKITSEIIFKGVDAFSPVVSKGARKAKRTMSGMEDFSPYEIMPNKAKKDAKTRVKSLESVGEAFSNIGSRAMFTGVALAAPLVYATKRAVEFEDAMGSVAKVADVQVGSAEFKALGDEVKQLSVYMGTTAEEAAHVYTNLAQGGILKQDLKDVAYLVADVGTAFNMSRDQASDYFITTRNALGANIAETKLVMDSINELSDKTGAKAEAVLTFLASGGAAVARNFEMSGSEVAAFGATLNAMGKSGEEAATIMERFQKNIFSNKDLYKLYLGAGGGRAGVLGVLEKGLSIKDKFKRKAFFQATGGEYGISVGSLAASLRNAPDIDGLRKSLGVIDAPGAAGSAARETANQQNKAAYKIRSMWAEAQGALIDFGTEALPIVVEGLKALTPIVKDIGKWVKDNPDTTKKIIASTAALAAFTIVVGGIASVAGAAIKTVAAIETIATFLGSSTLLAGITGTTAAVGVLGMTLGEFVVVGLAIGYVVKRFSEDSDWFRKDLVRLGAGVTAFFNNIGAAWTALKSGDFDKLMSISSYADREKNDLYRQWEYGIPSLQSRRERRNGNPYMNMAPGLLSPNPTLATPQPMGGGSSTMSFNPVINVNGDATPANIQAMKDTLNQQAQQFLKIQKKANKQQQRIGY